jgi:sugar O-acyltransferase (sialic acid O-acetyltransferase NeuD family)
MKRLILIGAGGHCRSCIDVIEKEGIYAIEGLIDLSSKVGQRVLGYSIIDSDENLAKYVNSTIWFLITLGQIRSPDKRIRIFSQLEALGAQFATSVSPLAYISKHAQIGVGTVVMHHALINAGVQVGKNCIINTKALIEHDANVGDHCHVATGSIINGSSVVHRACFIGSNSTVVNNVCVPENTFIRAGSLFK